MNPSKNFKNAILNLYNQGIYTVDYALIQAEAMRSRNRLTEADYNELIVYLAEEQEKEMTVEVNEEVVEEIPVEETTEEISAEVAENETVVEEA